MTNLQQIEARIEELRAELAILEAQAEEYYAAEEEAQMEQEIQAVRTMTNVDYLRRMREEWSLQSHYAFNWRSDVNAYYMSQVYLRRLVELGYGSPYDSLERIDAYLFRADCAYFGVDQYEEDRELMEEHYLDEWLDYADCLA